MIRIRNPAEAVFAILLLAVALILYWGSGDLRPGTAARMGPAYVPRLIAVLLAGMGLIMIVRSTLLDGKPVGAWPVRSILAIVSGLVGFSLLVQHAGLVAAVPMLVVLVSLGDRDLRPGPIAMIAVGLTAFASILFVQLLGLPIPLWKIGV
jgi:hypothetical protein